MKVSMQVSRKDRKQSDYFLRDDKWLSGRRDFLKNSVIAGIFAHTLFIQACLEDPSKIQPLTKKQYGLMLIVQNILFPEDQYGPSAASLKADKYVLWILNDPRMDQEEIKFMIDGLDWTEERAIEESGKSFLALKDKKQNEIIKKIAAESWGESWLSLNLTYIFEAMISDPVYGFNDQEAGWKWLEHQVGSPRPNEHNKYDEIFNSLNF